MEPAFQTPRHGALSRAVRLINYAILAVILAVGFGLYWLAARPLPQTTGRIATGVAGPVTVARDALGEPHITAGSLEDALFAQGYVTAQDRLWQMDGLRRLAGGSLAEVIGPAGLEADHDSRRLRMRRIAEQEYVALPAAERAGLAAYTRGVNAFLRAHLDRLPIEFKLLGYTPRPWSAIDSLLIGLHMYRTLTTSWRSEILKAGMLAAGDAARVNYLFPPRSGLEVQPGSNAWVISGARTATHRPLLSNDMHLEWSLPGIWYMVHLRAPGLNVAGVSLPGVPAVIVGHNDRIAWGVTNLQFDVQDLYIEQFDDRTGRYLFRGQVEQARAEHELIRVRGAGTEDMLVWITRHGPLFAAQGQRRLALRWAAADPANFDFPFMDIDRARNWREFTAAVARYGGPGQNFVYADVDGNIGYHASGRLPIRHGFAGDVPVDGVSGQFEWDGYIPFDQLPAAYNPPSGMIVTANQNPFPASYPYVVNGNFAPHYRPNQIRDLLASRRDWTAEGLLAVQKDVYSGFEHFLAQQLVAAYDRRKAHNPSLEPAIALLRSWNGQMDRDLAAPLITTLAYRQLRQAAAEIAAPGKGAEYTFTMDPAVIEKLLRERPAGWFMDYDLALLRALVDGLEAGRKLQGSNVAKWHYGAWLKLYMGDPVLDGALNRLPVLGKFARWFWPDWGPWQYKIGPAWMSGGTTTVKQTTPRLGPSMRMNADPSDWDRSRLNLVTGESGQVFSSHFTDQWPAYFYAQTYPMQFTHVQAKSVLELIPR